MLNRRYLLLALPVLVACRDPFNDVTESGGEPGEAVGTDGSQSDNSSTTSSESSDDSDGEADGDVDSGDGDGDGDTGDGDTGDGDTGDGDGDTGSTNSPPQIVSFDATATTIGGGDTVTFTAVVTDPDGLRDLIGGQLTSTDGSLFFGSFMAVGNGTFTLNLTWNAIDQIDPIVQDDDTREFRAEFFDMGAASDDTLVNLTLSCGNLTLCDGDCVNTNSDVDNCGGCGHACIDQASGCTVGECEPSIYECFEVIPPQGNSCGQVCLSMGESCLDQGCDGFTFTKSNNQLSCNDGSGTGSTAFCNEPVYNFGAGWYGCCCTDTP